LFEGFDITLCNPLKVNRRCAENCRLHLQGWTVGETKFTVCILLISCLGYSSTLKMEVIYSFETSVGFQQAALHHTPDDRTLQNHCENLKSHMFFVRLCIPILSSNYSEQQWISENRFLRHISYDKNNEYNFKYHKLAHLQSLWYINFCLDVVRKSKKHDNRQHWTFSIKTI
jgi:hypothetical protein